MEYLFNAFPRVDLNAKCPQESWSQKATISGVRIAISSFFFNYIQASERVVITNYGDIDRLISI